MPIVRFRLLLALAVSLGVHAGLLALEKIQMPSPPPPLQESLEIDFTLAPEQPVSPRRPALPAPTNTEKQTPVRVPDAPSPPLPEKQPATMAAPPAPSSEKWALGSTYPLKNSKR